MSRSAICRAVSNTSRRFIHRVTAPFQKQATRRRAWAVTLIEVYARLASTALFTPRVTAAMMNFFRGRLSIQDYLLNFYRPNMKRPESHSQAFPVRPWKNARLVAFALRRG